jgi:hypothetical protein
MEILAFVSFGVLVIAWLVAPSRGGVALVSDAEAPAKAA